MGSLRDALRLLQPLQSIARMKACRQDAHQALICQLYRIYCGKLEWRLDIDKMDP